MGLTPNHQLPYPEPADPPDVPADIYELANRLDGVITARELALAQRIEALDSLAADIEERVAALEALEVTADV